jgi:hypothetical protein
MTAEFVHPRAVIVQRWKELRRRLAPEGGWVALRLPGQFAAWGRIFAIQPGGVSRERVYAYAQSW